MHVNEVQNELLQRLRFEDGLYLANVGTREGCIKIVLIVSGDVEFLPTKL